MARAMYDKSTMVVLCGPAGTGKSRTWLEKVHLLCEKYPGCRALIVRKTRESLSEAALFTLETMVLPEGHPILNDNRRSHRTVYPYPNGSEIVVAGLDRPQKLMSTEFDIIYVQEITECEQADIEMLMTRLRNGVTRYQQLVADCNPDKPMHWVNQSALKGVFPMYHTWHEDNPVLWEEAPKSVQRILNPPPPTDPSAPHPNHGVSQTIIDQLAEMWAAKAQDGRRGRWTERGIDYIAKLDKLTGARYKRLRLGLWATAEGAVYEEAWDADHNIIKKRFSIPHHWRRFWSVDFGFTAPFVLQKWAIDDDGRMLCYEEHYITKQLVSTMGKLALYTSGWRYDPDVGHRQIRGDAEPLPETIVCDVDAEGRATLEQETGLHITGAYKGISDGIQGVHERLVRQADGRARLFFFQDALYQRDTSFVNHEPQCTIEEFDGYIWDTTGSQKKGEKPLGKDDHGMDATRYAVCYVDNIRMDTRAKDVSMVQLEDAPLGMVVGIPRATGIPQRDHVREGTNMGRSRNRTHHTHHSEVSDKDNDGNGYYTSRRLVGGSRTPRGLAEERAAKTGRYQD